MNPLGLGIFGALDEVENKRTARADKARTLEEALQDRQRKEEDRQRTIESALYAKSQRPALEAHLQADTDRLTRMPEQNTPRTPNVTDPNGVRREDKPGQSVYMKPVAAKTPTKKYLPAANVDKLANLKDLEDTGTDLAKGFSAAIKTGVNATGRLGGVIPTAAWMKNAVNMGGDEGGRLRDQVGRLSSYIGNALSGQAISPSEAERLQKWVPGDNDDETTILRKLNSFNRTMKEIREGKQKMYSAYGYAGPGEKVMDPSPDAGDDDEEYQEFLRQSGRKP